MACPPVPMPGASRGIDSHNFAKFLGIHSYGLQLLWYSYVMDSSRFKEILKDRGMTYLVFADSVGSSESRVKAVASGRNKVPDEWADLLEPGIVTPIVTKAGKVTPSGAEYPGKVTKPEEVTVTNPQKVTLEVTVNSDGIPVGRCLGLSVDRESAEKGHPEFDIMSDGFARGFPGDTYSLRVARTTHAIRRMIEKKLGPFETKHIRDQVCTPATKEAVKAWNETKQFPER